MFVSPFTRSQGDMAQTKDIAGSILECGPRHGNADRKFKLDDVDRQIYNLSLCVLSQFFPDPLSVSSSNIHLNSLVVASQRSTRPSIPSRPLPYPPQPRLVVHRYPLRRAYLSSGSSKHIESAHILRHQAQIFMQLLD